MSNREEQIRKEITDMFVLEYIPELKSEVLRFNTASISKHFMAMEVSQICGEPIGIELGHLRVADPTNKLIDKLVEYVRVQNNR